MRLADSELRLLPLTFSRYSSFFHPRTVDAIHARHFKSFFSPPLETVEPHRITLVSCFIGFGNWDYSLTNTRLGLDQLAGMASAFGSSLIKPVHFARPPDFRVVPAYFSWPIASRRAAIRMA